MHYVICVGFSYFRRCSICPTFRRVISFKRVAQSISHVDVFCEPRTETDVFRRFEDYSAINQSICSSSNVISDSYDLALSFIRHSRSVLFISHTTAPLCFACSRSTHVTCSGPAALFSNAIGFFVNIQGGPAKVRPTYIFDGNI